MLAKDGWRTGFGLLGVSPMQNAQYMAPCLQIGCPHTAIFLRYDSLYAGKIVGVVKKGHLYRRDNTGDSVNFGTA